MADQKSTHSITVVPLFGYAGGSYKQECHWAVTSEMFVKLPEYMQKMRVKYNVNAQAISADNKHITVHYNTHGVQYSKEGLMSMPDTWEHKNGCLYDRENNFVGHAVYVLYIGDSYDPWNNLTNLFSGPVTIAKDTANYISYTLTGTMVKEYKPKAPERDWDPCR